MKASGIAIHGGAGTILRSLMTPEKEKLYREALTEALMEGWKKLNDNGSAVDAVEKAVEVLEDNILFNAGKGSVFTNEGLIEMDASIMDGRTLCAGSVSSVMNVRNPVCLARKVMDESDFVYLNGKGAEEFSRLKGLKFEPPEYFFSEYRYAQLLKAIEEDRTSLDHSVHINDNAELSKSKKHTGTVGAVALDASGNLASATSTGGMTNKKFGRIGDSPVIGSGTYANNRTCAVSATGHGEFFLRSVTAYDISALMEYKKLTLKQACEEAIGKVGSLGGDGGVIAIDKDCNIEMVFNSEGMYRAWISSGKEAMVEIYS